MRDHKIVKKQHRIFERTLPFLAQQCESSSFRSGVTENFFLLAYEVA
jgi:hypothetical protein